MDPLRWGLLSYDVKQQHINLNLSVIGSAGAWCNKVWQMARYLHLAHTRVGKINLDNLPKNFQPGLMDMWILGQLAQAVQSVNSGMEKRQFHMAIKDLRKFIYTDLCDTYIEYIKPDLSDQDNSKPVWQFLRDHILAPTLSRILSFCDNEPKYP